MAKQPKHDWTQFLLKIYIDAAPERLYQAWTDSKKLKKWFIYDGFVEPKKGGRFKQVFSDGSVFESEVLEVRKNRLFRFTFGKVEKVEVKFRKSGKGGEVWLRQYDMRTGAEDKWSMHMGCRLGWTFFLTNLKAMLEHRADLRSHNPKKTWKQHYINS
jgi:uncharacterized protein YndB with AHSA1/START domain